MWHKPGYRYVLSTAVARFVWTLGVALQLSVLAGQVGLLSEFGSENTSQLITIEEETEKSLEDSDSSLTKEQAEDTSELEEDLTALLTDAKEKSIHYKKAQRQALASFIYEFEADSRSRCAHPEGTRVIELNDYEILQIAQTPEDEIGYTYTVEPCRSAAIGLD